LGEAFEEALGYLEGLPSRPLSGYPSLSELRAALGGPLPEQSLDPRQVVADLAVAAEPGVVASGSGRFFGSVVGGAMPAALAADWLASTWDQNAGLYVLGPAASVVEEVAGEWLAELLGLPAGVSVGFVTGAQMANFTGLAIALQEMLRRAGWDLARDGLWAAPEVRIIAGKGRHGTIDRALRFLGAGVDAIVEIESDDQGRMLPTALAAALEQGSGPAIVCAQVGNVNSGAIDPVGEICEIAHRHEAWVHVDGAFGLWAAASRRFRPLVGGSNSLIPGRPTPTNGSMCRTTRVWRFVLIPTPIERPWEARPATSCPPPVVSATRWTITQKTLVERAGSRCTRRSAHSAARAWQSSWSAAVNWRTASPNNWRRG
jgi:Pyridoxal-dependent decarboxylase conserved domain